MVVQHVAEPGEAELLDQVAPHHGVDQHAGRGAELVEATARHGVPGNDHRLSRVLNAVPEGRTDGSVISGGGGDAHRALLEDQTALDLGDGGRGGPLQVVVVGQAVADVRLEHGPDRLTRLAVPGGPYTGSGLGWNDVTQRLV